MKKTFFPFIFLFFMNFLGACATKESVRQEQNVQDLLALQESHQKKFFAITEELDLIKSEVTKRENQFQIINKTLKDYEKHHASLLERLTLLEEEKQERDKLLKEMEAKNKQLDQYLKKVLKTLKTLSQ